MLKDEKEHYPPATAGGRDKFPVRLNTVPLLLALLVPLLLFLSAVTVKATTYTVDDDPANDPNFTRIQDAINVSSDGDTIIVAPGTYSGSGNRDMSYNGKMITIQCSDPNDPNTVATTIIDTGGTESFPHRAFNFENSEDANSVLIGFTIINGYGPTERIAGVNRSVGGAIFLNNASPVIKKCVFFNNKCGYFGGAVCSYDSSKPTFTSCAFAENRSFYHGGAWSENIASASVLTDCQFINNISDKNGGAIVTYVNCALKLNNCQFEGNSGNYGGAIYNYQSTTTLDYCYLKNNESNYDGGAIRNSNYGFLELYACTFTGNHAPYGGAIAGSSGDITNSTFTNNHANYGGAIYDCDGKIFNCTIAENHAQTGGGIDNCSGNIDYCIISANHAQTGGGISQSSGKITNCLITANHADQGSAIYKCNNNIINCTIASNRADPNQAALENCNGQKFNCIIIDNEPNQLLNCSGQIQYTCIASNYPGLGNLDVDPQFAQPGYWDPNSTPDEPNDDFWIDGDYRLKSTAGRWDPNSSQWTNDQTTSLCIDAGNPATPLALEPNDTNNLRANLGAYGCTSQASKSPPNWSLLSDINNDGITDLTDLNLFLSWWLKTTNNLPADFDHNNQIDLLDYRHLTNDWQNQTSWHSPP
ncbi:MAG: hypothetical protein JXD22_09475 [Sedimentisphaerales bacterium]|nr:hypothetical protein [Sedimentisphaerales bacterium]